MKSGRFSISVALFAMACIFLSMRSFAFWESSETEGRSGERGGRGMQRRYGGGAWGRAGR